MILFLTNADTEILALRVVAEVLPEAFPELRAANPANTDEAPSLDGVELVVARLLGGAMSWEGPFEQLRLDCVQRGVPLVALGGEAVPDAGLAAASSVPAGTLRQAHAYVAEGGVANLENLLRFLADTVLMTGFGFEPPVVVPLHGVLDERPRDRSKPLVGVVFYRAHLLAGNTQFVEDLCRSIEALGANAVAVFTYSLRPDAAGEVPAAGVLESLSVDAVITTTLVAGSLASGASTWDPGALARLDVPVVQAICSTSSSVEWSASAAGLSPIDMAMSVAIPEFDGRIVSVPFSFKETVEGDEVLGTPLSAYRTRPDRVERVAELAVRLAALGRMPPGERRVAVVLSAYPTKRSRLGNAVGLDTPRSVVRLLRAMSEAGYRVDPLPDDADSLMADLAWSMAHAEQAYDGARDFGEEGLRALGVGRMRAEDYCAWFSTLPADFADKVCSAWGEPPGAVGVSAAGAGKSAELCFPTLDLGSVVVALQPARGFGEDPVAVYHSPDLPPTHQYLAFYRYLDLVFGAHAIVHVGKHGTLEWLPGKGAGLSASCAPDAALGSVPLVYPFVVNDPGEGAQAKRRSHAVIVDHLVPPLTRADTYDDLARLESLLDEHARVAGLDPSKLPAVRKQVWECLVSAEIHRDLGLDETDGGPASGSFDDPAFDDLVASIDGYLCELKDAQIRGGLHVLSCPPSGEAELDFVAAMTRLPQGGVPSLRRCVAEELGVDLAAARRKDVDLVDAHCMRLLRACQAAGWRVGEQASAWAKAEAVLDWVCASLVPALRATVGEVPAILHALDGGFVAPGPSGAPSRGQADVLPTGRNFYALDPRGVPSRLSWEVGQGLARALCERYVAEEGRCPRSVGIVVWGTAAMRTGGDDVAQALALLGVRPVWADEGGRVVGVEAIALDELGRARVDVTLRVSGFFRDAFPHVIDLFDEAVELVASLDEPLGENPLVASGPRDPRVFGPKPGAYGSGILEVIDSGNWRSDDDLAAVYLAWGGWSYGRSGYGAPAPEALRRRLGALEVAVKNQDNREHDIFDSDDYLQDHGGMIVAMRAISGRSPKAFFGDSSDPNRPRVRSLAEEAARVVRSRVVNPKWISAMMRHGYKGAFEMAATVDYLFGYDATAGVVQDWMYERVTRSYVGDPEVRKFFEASNPWALKAIAERLLEASDRGMWDASEDALATLRSALLEAEGWEEDG